jgi:hypothetical protein
LGTASPAWGVNIMRRTFGSFAVLLSLAGPLLAGAADYFSESGKDFGPTPRGPILTHYFSVTNTTQQTVTIGSARVSCGCVSPTIMKSQLKPGDSTAVYVAMDTRRIPQSYIQKTVIVYVPFYAPTMEEVQLKVSAIARDDMVLSPEGIAFGNVKMGTAKSSTAKLTIYNQANLQVTGFESTGGHVKVNVQPGSKGTNDTTFEITADLDSKCPVGHWTAELFVKTNTPGLEKIRVPVSVIVTTPIAVVPDAITVADTAKPTEHSVMLQSNQAFKILQVKGVDDVISVKANAEDSRPVHILTVTVKPKDSTNIARLLEIETDHKEMAWIKVPVVSPPPQPIKK